MMGRLRFGVVGTNTITEKVIAGGQEDARFELVAVCSRKQETADAFAHKHQIPYMFTSIDEMASSPHIDAVYVASPNSCHAAQSIICMEHGKHVLCEKALASHAGEARSMVGCARRNGVVLMEAMKPTLTPNFGAVQKALWRIGAIRRYFSCYCQYSSRYDAYRTGTVLNAFQPELSNGALLDIGVYTIYPMVVLFGRPRAIYAAGLKLASGVDGEGSIVFSYPEMDATVLYSKITNSQLPTEIQGEDGNIVLDRINIIGEVNLQVRNGQVERLSTPIERNEYYWEVKEFIDTVQSGKQESPTNSWENSLATMDIMDEIRRQIGIVYPADSQTVV